jgi:hypothetical protein
MLAKISTKFVPKTYQSTILAKNHIATKFNAMNRKVALIIMDGWGHGTQPDRSAIAQANVPYINSLYDKYANTELITMGRMSVSLTVRWAIAK